MPKLSLDILDSLITQVNNTLNIRILDRVIITKKSHWTL